MKTYARPPASVPPALAGWWQTVEPYLTARARKQLHRDDPLTVPFTAVVGAPTRPRMGLTHGDPCVYVDVPTDGRVWTVTVVTNRFDQMLIDAASPRAR